MKLSLGNSKAGPSFSLPHGTTCPGKTEACRFCYVQYGRMKMWGDKRAANLRDLIDDMDNAGVRLACLIKDSGRATIRIHDSGDFFSVPYIMAWIEAARANPDVKFWAYTRSFTVAYLLPALEQLAALPNVALWASADEHNWMSAVCLSRNTNFIGIAFMQTADTDAISRTIQSACKVNHKRFVNFPQHGSFGRVVVPITDTVFNCPVETREIQPSKESPACLRCRACLPTTGEN